MSGNSLLLHEQKADFDAQQQKPDFATRDAKLEDSLNKYLPQFEAAKTDFSYLTNHTYAEVLPDERPTDTVLEVLENIPVRTPDAGEEKSMDGAGDRRAGGKHRRHRPEPLPRETDANGPPQG